MRVVVVVVVVVVGGSDAGISAGLRARELDASVEVTLVVADAYPNFSICGLPYFLSGDVADWRSLAHRTTSDLQAAGLRLLLDHTAHAIDPARKQVTVAGAGTSGSRVPRATMLRLPVRIGGLAASPMHICRAGIRGECSTDHGGNEVE